MSTEESERLAISENPSALKPSATGSPRRWRSKARAPGTTIVSREPMDASTTTLMIIRHGETVWNIEERFQGHGDSPLTKTGRQQARAVADRLKTVPFDLLIASDLGRAIETAGFIAETTGHEIQTSPLLRERHYGVLEGLTLPEISRRHPRVLQKLKSDDPDYEIPSGESHRRHYSRNVAFFETFLQENSGKTAALVVHGGVLDSIFRYAAALPLSQPRCFITRNTSVGIVRYGVFYGTSRWIIDSWGDVAHLRGVDSYQGLG